MASVNVYDKNGQEIGAMELPDALFSASVSQYAVHAAVTAYLAAQRIGVKGTKTRAEVSGGGAKPWRQKGTGRARQGSRRSPQWKGGGVVFAPKTRDYSVKINKKVRRAALKSVLTQKYQDKKLLVLEDLNLDEIKTKKMSEILTLLKLKSALIVMENGNDNARLSCRNIQGVTTCGVNSMNVYNILKYDNLVFTRAAVSEATEVYA